MTALGISWGGLSHSWVLLIIAVFIMLSVYRYVQINFLLRQSGLTFHNNLFLQHYSPIKRLLKLLLLCIGLSTLGLAFLQPRWGKKEDVVQQEGRDLFIMLDISRSMLAQDCKPDRLSCAKKKIHDLVNLLKTDRVGLVVFAGKPIVHCPLTQDMGAFNLFLDQIDSSIVGSGTTALENALAKVLDQFESMPSRQHRLAILLTDGEDFSHNLAAVRQRAQQQGLHIFAMGLGSEQGVPIPDYDEQGNKKGFVKDEKGAVVISRLNEGLLKSLSKQVGGIYVSPTEDDEDVRRIISYVERFEKEAFENRHVTSLQEQYPWFVGISFFCFLIEWLL